MQIIRQLFEIIIRKRQPQDLDYNSAAALISLISSIAIGYMVYSVIPQISKPLMYNIAMVLLQTVAIYGFLAINQKATRFIQTITAIFGVTVILQIITVGLGQLGVLASFAFLVTLWNLILVVFIMRTALECSTIKAVFVTLGYHLFMGIVMSLIFPNFPGELQAMLEAAQNSAP